MSLSSARLAVIAALVSSTVLAGSSPEARAQEPAPAPAPDAALVAPPVVADGPAPPSPEAVRASEELFARGRELLRDPATLDEACATLARSLELRARGDVLLNLAECHRRQGKTATAWREFDEAIRYAEAVEFAEAIEAAKRYRDLLAKDLFELVVEVPSPPAGLTVLLDGKRLPSEQWGVALFVDPGTHVVSAEAAGHEPFSGAAEVKPRAGRAVIGVALKKIPEPAKPPPPKPPPPKPVEASGPPAWAIAVGSAGVVLMGVSVAFGISTASVGGTLDEQCGDTRDACVSGYDFASDRSTELTSFGLFVGLGLAGIGATGVGVAGLLLGGDEAPADRVAVSPWVGPAGAGLGVSGTTW